MSFGSILSIGFIALWSIVINTSNDTLASMLVVNATLQLPLFILLACIPYLRTGRMSYVDIAWPLGVATIGAVILVMGDGDFIRRAIVGGIYLMIGLRMGLGAVTMGLQTGVIFKVDFPRYKYRRMVFERDGTRHIRFHTLAEIMAQGFANASVLALPGFMLAVNSSSAISGWEIAGIGIWLLAYLLESTADLQKLKFISKKENQGAVCNVGLWHYSRHPNYFSEWLVWTGLVIAAIPSWLALQASETTVVWAAMGVGAAGASAMLYTTLVYLTGAVPSEYYSVRKRPGYAEYQRTTNRFFPWFPSNSKKPK